MSISSKDTLIVYLRQEALISELSEAVRGDLPQDNRRSLFVGDDDDDKDPSEITVASSVLLVAILDPADERLAGGLADFIIFLLKTYFFLIILPTVFLLMPPRSFLSTFQALQLIVNLALIQLNTPPNLDLFFCGLYQVANWKMFYGAFDITKLIREHGDKAPYNTRFHHIGGYETQTLFPALGSACTVFILIVCLAGLMHIVTYKLLVIKSKQFVTWYTINRFFSFFILAINFVKNYFFVITIACFLNM